MISTASGGLRHNGCTYGTDRPRTAPLRRRRFRLGLRGRRYVRHQDLLAVTEPVIAVPVARFFFSFAQFILRHLTHFRIIEHHLCGFDIFLNLLPVGKTARNIT